MGLANWTLYWAFGPGFGMLIGIVIGSIMDLNKDKKQFNARIFKKSCTSSLLSDKNKSNIASFRAYASWAIENIED